MSFLNKKPQLELFYDRPAQNWDEALPVGNGRLGGMVFSQPLNEQIQLNEDSVWSGGKRTRNNLSAYENLEKVRSLLAEEKISEAEEIVRDAFCGTTTNCRHYMPLCDLLISMQKSGDYTNYSRTLDLENSICKTIFTIDGITYTRSVIASAPNSVIAVNIRADKPASITIKARLDGRDDYFDDYLPVSADTFVLTGGMGGKEPLEFRCVLSCTNVGGRVFPYGNFLCTEECDEVTLLIAADTSYRAINSIEDISKAKQLPFETLLQRHIEDYKSFFARFKLTLCDNSDGGSALTTDKRLEAVRNGKPDNKLISLYHAFARYLMISGSREGTLPLNLQGIWNKDMWPAWGGRFTVNINAEMNYWCAEGCNLSELHTPLFDLIEKIRENGRATAWEMYHCKGFCCHHNTDLWGDTAPQDLWMPATQWPMGAAWLCLHIWEHYLFTLDKDFLAQKLDTLLECAAFFEDFLVEDKKGRLVTSPSVSPENTYLTKSNTSGCLCIGPSMDSQIIYELFSACAKGCDILGVNSEKAKKLLELRDRLPEIEIGKYGQIMEWAEDYDEVEPGHRHISQLFALFPADRISRLTTPELCDAARATLERRLSHGGGHTGWSRAWISNLWARLGDGERVYENITALLAHSTNNNLFDSHPPFQIDGNFGGASAIQEALLQSSNGVIYLLPALPDEWSEGSFSGFRCRGGFETSASWENCRLTNAKITSLRGSRLSLQADYPFYCTHNGTVTYCSDRKYTASTSIGDEILISLASEDKTNEI